MYNDDELIGLEDMQEFELELLYRKRRSHLLDIGQKSESMTALRYKSKHECQLETEIILESAVIIKPDRDSSPDREPAAAPSGSDAEPLPGSKPIPDQESNHSPFEDTRPESKTDFIENPGTGEDAVIGPGTESDLPAPVFQQCRFAILSEKLMDDRRYVALAKSIDDLQYRNQLFEEYGIAPTDTTKH